MSEKKPCHLAHCSQIGCDCERPLVDHEFEYCLQPSSLRGNAYFSLIATDAKNLRYGYLLTVLEFVSFCMLKPFGRDEINKMLYGKNWHNDELTAAELAEEGIKKTKGESDE